MVREPVPSKGNKSDHQTQRPMNQPITSMIQFKGPDHDVNAYVSRPEFSGKWPGLILIHEIWGLVPHTKKVADRFAAEGFAVLAPDLMGSEPELAPIFTPENIQAVQSFMRGLPPGKSRDHDFVQKEIEKLPETERGRVGDFVGKVFGGGLPYESFSSELSAGLEHLKSQEFVNARKIGSLGFCFGGGMSFRLSCTGATQACVVFYGPNPDPIELVEKINCPILGIYGGEDAGLNASLDKLVAAVVKYEKDFEMRIYPGAPHGFFNDANLNAYRQKPANESWERTMDFLGRTLKSAPVISPR